MSLFKSFKPTRLAKKDGFFSAEEYKMKSLILCCFLSIFSLTYGAKLTTSSLPFHKRLDLTLLNDTIYSNIYYEDLEYEIVKIQMLSNMNDNGDEEKSLNVFAFGEDISLKLREDEDLNNRILPAKTFMMTDKKFEEIIFENNDTIRVYQDLEQKAAFSIVYRETGNFEMEGTIGNLIIKPIPGDIMIYDKEFNRNYELLPYSEKQSLSAAHIVIKIRIWPDLFGFDLLYPKIQINSTGVFGPRKRKVPVVYPEIILLVDYDNYLTFDQNDKRVLSYYYSVLSNIDLRYRTLRNPTVKIILSAILIAKNKGGMPFLEKNQMNETYIEVTDTLKDFSKYLYENSNYIRQYDIALIMTKFSLCSRERTGECKPVIGVADGVGSACKFSIDQEEIEGIGIVEDVGGQKSASIAAHEIAHLLGVEHDGTGSAFQCRRDVGFLMDSVYRSAVYEREWSECSRQQFSRFLNSPEAKCLYNYPNRRY
ncbi:a disintegrin and metalloproteinase with thrombospondin motifs 6 [Caerostris darwini]|uniref:A disintegrin and metalloproteinase with thrombospondin motifs 6 n=1 Tax=Caerostris darwini TaxID=1538125 RepID=A0AAV4STV1_9ARAC|nr:a disintegrin and metalloproteinase with thrombospondin motifs 6 [Caerostris darwini]